MGSPRVQLRGTTVVGVSVPSYKQELFAGIPYAEPPTGPRRLKPLTPIKTPPGPEFHATKYGPLCLQNATPRGGLAEDCLTLNIVRPSGTTSASKLPVLVFFHGGGFEMFGSDALLFNGSALVDQSVQRGTPIVYVSFNYRIGPLGFPQGDVPRRAGALNLGLKDQLVVLEWIQSNIDAFGGDKTKVTAWGHSAGAMSIAIHQLKPSFSRLARAAILESGGAASTYLGSGSGSDPEFTRAHDWDNFVAAIPGCASEVGKLQAIPCLQGVNDQDVYIDAAKEAYEKSALRMSWKPAEDGDILPDLPSRLLARGQFAKIPFISGTNLDEGTMYADANVDYTPDIISEKLKQLLSGVGAGTASENEQVIRGLMELYPDAPALGSPFGTGNETFGLSAGFKRYAAMQGDIVYQSQQKHFREVSVNAGVSVYGYTFVDPQNSGHRGVAHAIELGYTFGVLNNAYKYQSNPKDPDAAVALSKDIVDYFLAFVTSLNPNDGKGIKSKPHWTRYTSTDKVLLHLESGLGKTKIVSDTDRAAAISYINNNPIVFGH